MTYGYRSEANFSKYFPQTLSMHSRRLVAQLSAKRETVSKERPIIFIAHSLGGLIVKHALVYASASSADRDTSYKSLQLSTIGVLFFGTPHREGHQLSWKKLLTRVMSVSRRVQFADSFDPLLSQAELFELELERYRSIEDKFLNYSFYEKFTTDTADGKSSIHAVPRDLALPLIQGASWHGCELRKTHENLVKFEGSGDPGYQRVLDALQDCLSHYQTAAHNCEAFERETDLSQSQELRRSRSGSRDESEGLSLNWRVQSFTSTSRLRPTKSTADKIRSYSEQLARSNFKDGEFDYATLRTATDLAQLYTDTNQDIEVDKLYKRLLDKTRGGLARSEKDHGYHDRKTLRMMAALAHLHAVAGQYHKAESLNKRLLVEVQDLCGYFSLEHAFILNQLAHNAYLQSDYDWAAALLLRVLNIQEAIYEERDEHPESLRTTARLAIIYDEQGNFSEAQRLYKKVIESRETSPELGWDHEDTIKTIENLAVSYRLQGQGRENLTRAAQAYEKALERRKRVLSRYGGTTDTAPERLGDARERLADTVVRLGGVYRELGEEEKAQALLEQWPKIGYQIGLESVTEGEESVTEGEICTLPDSRFPNAEL
jgi:tetratricopeptide (TPR) repeat protein